jgi:TolA-binding protein
LAKAFSETDYGMYAGLRIAWILTGRQAGGSSPRHGIYLDLTHKAKEPKVAEEACYFAAQVSLLDGHYDESASLFQMLRTKFPGSPRIADSALSAGWANFYAGRYKEGADVLDLVLGDAKHPQREEILYVKANCLRMMEQRAAAVALYDQQLAAFPTAVSRSWRSTRRFPRSTATANTRRSSKPRRCFLDPPGDLLDHVFWMNAEAAVALQRFDVAVQNCRLLVNKCPKSPFAKDALYRLGWLSQKQEAWESASSWYLQVAERFPGDPLAAKALYASGVCLSRLGQSEAALRDWTALLTQYPSGEMVPETLYQKAMEELRAKNPRAAGSTLDERLPVFRTTSARPRCSTGAVRSAVSWTISPRRSGCSGRVWRLRPPRSSSARRRWSWA